MRISRKLFIIVLLTIFEITITLWAVFQLSKGATFHQLNSLHLKYNVEFSEAVNNLDQANQFDHSKLEELVLLVRQQPVDCLAEVNVVDRFIMRMIGTAYALDLCVKDIRDADEAIKALDAYKLNSISRTELKQTLTSISKEFTENSSKFEKPITETVHFIFRTMIPMIIFISLFNIIFITYLSKSITGSIEGLIKMLSSNSSDELLKQELHLNVSGELQELLEVAEQRIKKDLMNIETNSELKKLVDEKTASLKLANEELEAFSYRISHDLKSPLTTSKRIAEFIQKDIERKNYAEAASNAHKIQHQMQKLEALITNIMELAKADIDESENAPFDLAILVEEILSGLKASLDDKGCELHYEIAFDHKINSNEFRIQLILENLLSNAIKYSDQTKDTRFVKLIGQHSNHVLSLEVIDNGVGIPEKYRKDLFTHFKRFHPHLSEGTGLGLSIVKKHLEKLKGHIEYHPLSDGSKFLVTIPLEDT